MNTAEAKRRQAAKTVRRSEQLIAARSVQAPRLTSATAAAASDIWRDSGAHTP